MKSVSSCVIVLNRVVDIAAAVGLYRKSPLKNTKILIVNFKAWDEYGWKKRKDIQTWMTQSDVNDVVGATNPEDVVIASSAEDYKAFVRQFDMCVCLGRELFIFKPLTKLSVGISGTRDYFNRYIDLISGNFYGDNGLIVTQNGDAWMKESECGDYRMNCDYDFINANIKSFMSVDPLMDQKSECDAIGKDEIRRELGFPIDKKVALISYRRADSWHTIFQSDEEFFQSSIKTIKMFKDLGYFIVCRRRMGIDDITSRRANSSEITRYDEIKPMVDLEVNGWSGYPNLLYKACYASDILAMIDTSGICQREASITEIPTYMPYDEKNEFTMNQIQKEWEPGMRDMVNFKVVSNNLEDLLSTEFKSNLMKYNLKWHSGNCEVFWKSILNRDIS